MDNKLIELLNKALSAEYQASFQYLNHYNNVRGKYTDIVDHFKSHMEEENGHASRLVQRIYVLGGAPVMKIDPPVAPYTDDVDEALKQDIVGERVAIELYSAIISYCESINDRATQVMIEDILTDEVTHMDEFAKIRRSTVTASKNENN